MDEKDFLLREKYNDKKTPAFEADMRRLAEGEPLAYIIGWVPFLDCKIYLDSRPLIPRSETEHWIERVINDMKKRNPPADMIYHISRGKRGAVRCLDLFAGSGCIGVAVLKHVPSATVDFGEINADHLPTISKNIEANGINPLRAQNIQSDIWENIPGTYDYVFANPPYLSVGRRERIGVSVLAHEPKEALFAEDDGFSFIEKTIGGLSAHLNPEGSLYIEHEPEHAEGIVEFAKKSGFNATAYPDQYGVLRYSTVRRS